MIEYGLLLIKPDGVGKCIEKLCENEIEKHKLEIVKKKQLSKPVIPCYTREKTTKGEIYSYGS